jgi:hypothetical protein
VRNPHGNVEIIPSHVITFIDHSILFLCLVQGNSSSPLCVLVRGEPPLLVVGNCCSRGMEDGTIGM